MKAVIYESNTGSTKRYAEMLAQKLGVPAYSMKEAGKAVPKGEEAVFLGWVFANKIQGLTKALKKWNIVCAGAVGMNPDCRKYRDILKDSNKTDKPIFYLRGALDLSKLRWLQRKLLQTIRTDLEKQKKPGTEDMIKVLRDGCDFISESNLDEIIAFTLSNR